MHSRPLQILVAIVVLALCGYLIFSGLTGPGRPRTIQEGVQTLTGSLVPAELSLTRRGTHVLVVDNENVAYVESPALNLRLYELTEVGLTGHMTLNTDPSDLPVFVVSSVATVDIPAVTVELPPVGLIVRAPATWDVTFFDDGAAFTLTGTTTPLLRIMRSSLTRLPAGTPMFIAGMDAVRIDSENGTQTVHLLANKGVISFTWGPIPAGGSQELTNAFAQLLRTAVLHSQPSSSAHPGTGFTLPSSAAADSAASAPKIQPCGGPAGVLCPAGSFCSVTGQDGVGTCVPLR